MESISGSVNNELSVVVEFDYTHFLCESAQEHWTFYDAFKTLLSTVKSLFVVSLPASHSSSFMHKASKQLSSRYSDETNLACLIQLAKRENVKQLHIAMPYQLDQQQVKELGDKCKVAITSVGGQNEKILVEIFK